MVFLGSLPANVRKPFRPPRMSKDSGFSQERSDEPPAAVSVPQVSNGTHTAKVGLPLRKSVGCVNSSKQLRRVYYGNDRPLEVVEPSMSPQKRVRLQPGVRSDESQPVTEDLDGTMKYEIMYRKPSTKKNKTWDNDGILVATAESGTKFGRAVVRKPNGEVVSKGRYENHCRFPDGTEMKIGSLEVQIQQLISGNCLPASSGCPVVAPSAPSVPPSSPGLGKENTLSSKKIHGLPVPKKLKPTKNTSLHDPTAPDAFVLPRPKLTTPGTRIRDVVVDPLLAKHLRSHQKAGVTFLYECVMGMRSQGYHGALLADEMGLGKTLTTITLLWTLLKQNPLLGEPPVVKRILIVCPVTLTKQWKREFRKWLGPERVHVFVADGTSDVRSFTQGNVYHVMIVGFEKLLTVHQAISQGNSKVDIVVVDEGHRLKSLRSKASKAILALEAEKKILLTGTPIQNDLGEFFSVMDFLNPGYFGVLSEFRRKYELPIMRSRDVGASPDQIARGAAALQELSQLAEKVVLRHTAEENLKHLPPRRDYVLFLRPTQAQIDLYRRTLPDTSLLDRELPISEHLVMIGTLQKICNSPKLVAEHNPRNTASAKISFLLSMLRTMFQTTDEKAVVVSRYTKLLDVLQNELKSCGFPVARLDGETEHRKRQAAVKLFNEAPQKKCFILLLSAKSGGVGLNLIGGSRLFLFDTDWNPAVDLQAMARIHREGQTRPTFIYRMLTSGTVEEKIFQRQLTKTGLAAQLMAESGDTEERRPGSAGRARKDKNATNTFSYSELKDLFTLYENTASNTHDLLQCECLNKQPHTPEVADKSPEPLSDAEGSQQPADLFSGWMPASQVQARAEGEEMQRKKMAMDALMQFKHIDPQRMVAECSASASDSPVHSETGRQLFLSQETEGSQDNAAAAVAEQSAGESSRRTAHALLDPLLESVLLAERHTVTMIFEK